MSTASRRLFFAFLSILLAAESRGQASMQGTGTDGEEIVQYLGSEGVVYGCVVRDSSGREIRRETYIRDSEGRIAEILTQHPDGSVSRLGYSGNAQWLDYPEGSRLLRFFSPDGKLRTEELRNGEILLQRTTYRYGEGSSAVSFQLTERPQEKIREEKEYDSGGRVIRETRVASGVPPDVSLYSYDDEKRLSEIRRLSGRTETRTRFFYGPGGTETEEKFDAAGAMVLRTVRKEDGMVEEEHFDAGILFARMYFREGRKIREEILKDGQIVRVWEAP